MLDAPPRSNSDEPHGPIWLRIAYRYGFPAAVAAFLLYFVTQVLATDVRAGLNEARQTREALSDHVLEMRMSEQQRVEERRRTERQLYGICMAIADGDPISERWCRVSGLGQ